MFKTVVTPFRVIVASLGWFALASQYWIAMTGEVGPEPVARTINFFSYFTIECNIAVALAMTLPWLAPRSSFGQFFSRPSVRTAIATYIIFVGVTFDLLLRHLRQLQGLALMIDNILHYVIPVLFVIDWLFFVVKGTLKPKSPLPWLSFPAAYVVWIFVHGALSGFYPYPFVNVGELGYPRVLLNTAGLFILFLSLGFLLVGIDRLIARARIAS